MFERVHDISQPRRDPINERGQDEGGKVRPPALRIGIELSLIKWIGAIVLVGDQLIPICARLVIALQPGKHLERLLRATDRFVNDLGRIAVGEFRSIKSPKLLTPK
jgi:hypothetical protein